MTNIESIIQTMIKNGSSPEIIRNTLFEMGISKEEIDNKFININQKISTESTPSINVETHQQVQEQPNFPETQSIDISKFKTTNSPSSEPVQLPPKPQQFKNLQTIKSSNNSLDSKSFDINNMNKKLNELKEQVESIPVDNITSTMELLSQERTEGLVEHSQTISDLSEKVSQVHDKIDASSPDNIKELTLAVDDLRKMLNEMKPIVFALHEIDKKILDTNREVLFKLSEKIHSQKDDLNNFNKKTLSKPSVVEKTKLKITKSTKKTENDSENLELPKLT